MVGMAIFVSALEFFGPDSRIHFGLSWILAWIAMPLEVVAGFFLIYLSLDMSDSEICTNEPITNEPITNEPITNEPITNEPITNET